MAEPIMPALGTHDAASEASRSGVSLPYIQALVGAAETRRILRLLGERPSRRLTSGGTAWIGYLTAWKVLNANVELSGDEGHGVSGAAVPLGNFELMMASLMQGASLADGLKRMAGAARILRPDLQFAVSSHNGRLSLGIGFAGPASLGQEIYAEALLIALHCAVRWGLGRPLAPHRLRGPAAVDASGGSVLDVLKTPVQRDGSGVTIVYRSDDAIAGFRSQGFARWHDAAFAEYSKLVNAMAAVNDARSPDLDDLVRSVRASLLEGCRSQEEVARRLALSTPTLRRRLAERGSSFRDIVSALKRDAAEVLLLGDKSMDDIACELGLSDSRCFRRACRAWFGEAPSEVRRSLRLARPAQLH